MFQLRPLTVTAELFLVLFAQGLPFYTVTFRQSTDADRSGLNLLLLKKAQTLR